ncbi:MAG: hypothetical protein Q4C96_04865 [Planctomycetia bacterium]|nr:hypothetical protein [Planctomycetia bacterium]
MKRTLFILLLALCPLMFLTFSAFYDFWTVPPRRVPDDQRLLAEVFRSNEETRQRSSRAEEFTKELARSDLFLGTSIPSTGFMKQNDPDFRSFNVTWKKWGENAEAIQEYLGLLFQFKSKNIPQLRRGVESVRKFRERYAQIVPEAGKGFLRIMEKLEEDLDARVLLAEKIQQVTELIAEARNAFDAKQYQLCRDKCNKVLTDYDTEEVLNTRVKTTVLMLKARSEVYVDTDILSEIKLENLDPKKRLEKLEAFLKTVEGADLESLEESERQMVLDFQEAARITRAEVMAEREEKRILKMLAKLRNEPPSAIPERLTAAVKTLEVIQSVEKMIKNSPEPESVKSLENLKVLRQNREMLHRTVRLWFTKLVPEIKSSLDDTIQEVTLKDGSILCGYFSEVKEGAKTVGYKCYSTLKEFQNPTVSVGTYPVEDFQLPLTVPYEKIIVEEYVRLRGNLLERLHSRGAWVDFQNGCQRLGVRLKEHQKKEGVRKTKVHFRNSINTARVVLETENWRNMEKIFQ